MTPLPLVLSLVVAGCGTDDPAFRSGGTSTRWVGHDDLPRIAVAWSGEAPGDQAGYEVAAAGDIDGDGQPDVLVGATTLDAAGVDAGGAYLLSGSQASLGGSLSSAAARLLRPAPGERWGVSLAGPGDLDGDGFGEVAIGSSMARTAAGVDAGQVVILPGPLAGDVSITTSFAWFDGEHSGDFAGRSLAVAGDICGDGGPDLLVGANGNDEGGDGAGAVYLLASPFAGGTDLADAQSKFVGEAAGDWLGSTTLGAGDLDGDGTLDIATSGYASDTAGLDAGTVYVFSAPQAGTVNAADATGRLFGTDAGDWAGRAIAAADFDGDGYGDLLVGAPLAGTRAGGAWLVSGPIAGDRSLSDADAHVIGDIPGAQVGDSLAAEDLDADGLPDAVVSAHLASEGAEAGGAVALLYGPLSGAVPFSEANAMWVGTEANALAGWSLAAAGDVDGDGLSEVIVGARGDGDPSGLAGTAWWVPDPTR